MPRMRGLPLHPPPRQTHLQRDLPPTPPPTPRRRLNRTHHAHAHSLESRTAPCRPSRSPAAGVRPRPLPSNPRPRRAMAKVESRTASCRLSRSPAAGVRPRPPRRDARSRRAMATVGIRWDSCGGQGRRNTAARNRLPLHPASMPSRSEGATRQRLLGLPNYGQSVLSAAERICTAANATEIFLRGRWLVRSQARYRPSPAEGKARRFV